MCIRDRVNDAEDKLFHKILYDASHVLSMLLPERRITNLLILYVHVGTTGRYHNESLDSLTIILLYGSFLKIVINILFTHHCIYASCHVH